jgi:hypothetical protein
VCARALASVAAQESLFPLVIYDIITISSRFIFTPESRILISKPSPSASRPSSLAAESVSELLSGACFRVCRKLEFVLLKRRLNCNANGEGACVFHFVSNVIIGQMN